MQRALENALQPWAVTWRHRALILRMIRREIAGRYLGSMLGLVWTIVHPLAMLLVFTFAFKVVFKSRWTGAAGSGGEPDFAVAMFIGLIIYSLFCECLARAPGLVLGHVNYVKKVVFPLEILAAVVTGTALFNAGMALIVWLGLVAVAQQALPWTIVLLPVLLLPLVLMCLGLVWLLASLGVFIRDLGQLVGLGTMALLFLSPVFYPVSAVPAPFGAWMHANPLTGIIEEARSVAVFGALPDWGRLGVDLVVGLAVAQLGFLWFERTRRGFADVL
jgi:lipopolysaccharide transport system permease protein